MTTTPTVSTKARFIAKPYGTVERDPKKAKQWGVYDTEKGSWPGMIPGFGRVPFPLDNQRSAKEVANRLADHYGIPRTYGEIV